MNGIEYNGANTEAIYHSEGRLTPNGTTAWYYEYSLRDHLGNARVNFRANGAAPQFLDEHHYYPFGMEMEGFAGGGSPYRYNNKEITADFGVNWYFYGARWYDAAVGRWWSVDPLADKYNKWSPYNFVADNPLIFIDPDGMDLVFAFQNKDTKSEDKVNLQRQLNEGLGGYYTASIDKKGKVSITAVEGKDFSEASDQVKGFYDVLNESVSAEGKVKINVLNGDDNTVIGAFPEEAIDMKDLAAVERIDNNSGVPNAVTAQSKLAHEITEQQ